MKDKRMQALSMVRAGLVGLKCMANIVAGEPQPAQIGTLTALVFVAIGSPKTLEKSRK